MSLSSSLLKSSSFLFLMRFFGRGIGLISTFILARVLTPEDYGVVALATLVVFFFDAFSNSGMREYIIQKTDLSTDDLNTAWTLNLGIKSLFWLAFVVAVPWISDYYEKPELSPVLWAVSIILPISAMENVGLNLYRRELIYKPIFNLGLVEKLLSFSFMLLLLLFMDSYWIMILYMVSAYVIRLIGSYMIHDHRPRLCTSNIKAQWDFSKWIMPQGVVGFLKAEFDTMIVSKLFNFGALGGFNLMKSLTGMVGRDIITPATEPLLAAFSKAKGDHERVQFQVGLSLWVIVALIAPIVTYMWSHSYVIIMVLYGDQWGEYAPVLSALSFLVILFSLMGIFQRLLTSMEKVKILFYYELAGFFFVAAVLLSLDMKDIVEFAAVRTSLALVLAGVMLFYVKFLTKLPLLRLIFLMSPIFVAVAMSLSVVSHLHFLSNYPILIELLISGSVFVFVYGITLLAVAYLFRGTEEIAYLKWVIKGILNPIVAKFSGSKSA